MNVPEFIVGLFTGIGFCVVVFACFFEIRGGD